MIRSASLPTVTLPVPASSPHARATEKGRRAARSAILGHAGNIRRYFLDSLTPEFTAAIRAWSEQMVDHLEPRCGETAGDMSDS
jgi:hypothetical protein